MILDFLLFTGFFWLLLSKYSSWQRRLEDVYVRLSHTFSQDIFKKSCKNVFKTSSRRLAKIYLKGLQNVFKTCCKNVLKTSARSFEDVFNTTWEHLQDVFQICLQDVFKTYRQVQLFNACSARPWDLWETVFKTSSRHFQDIFKTSWKDVFKTFTRPIIKLNCYC